MVSLCAQGGLPRDAHWALDLINVDDASRVVVGGNGGSAGGNNGGGDVSGVPIPAAFFLFGGALAGFGGLSRMKRKKA